MLHLLWAHGETHCDTFLGVSPKLLSHLTRKRQHVHPVRWAQWGRRAGGLQGPPSLEGSVGSGDIEVAPATRPVPAELCPEFPVDALTPGPAERDCYLEGGLWQV